MVNKAVCIAFIAVASTAFILNIIESFLIIRMRKRWKPFDKMLLSLSFADQLVAVTTIVYYFIALYDVTIGGCKLTQHHFILLLISSEDFSLFHILAITVDRFCAIKYPVKHSIKMHGKLPHVMILTIWGCVTLLATAFATVLFLRIESFAFLVKLYSVLAIVLGLCFVLAYKHMFRTVLTKSSQAQNRPKCNLRDVLKHSSCKTGRAVLLTSFLVVFSYIICMYPISIELLARTKIAEISSATQFLLVMNSIMNPLVYFFKGYCDKRIKQISQKSHSKRATKTSPI